MKLLLMGARNRPVVDWSFLGGALPAGLAFTRASNASFIAPNGTVAQAAVNAPRFDYDPATLTLRGLLLEDQSTNFVRNNTMVGAATGTPGTLPTNWSEWLGGLSRQIVATGTENGIPYIDYRVFGTAAGGNTNLWFDGNMQIAATSGQVWTSSLYIRKIAGSLSNIVSAQFGTDELTSAGAYTTGTSVMITSSLTATNIACNRFAISRTMGATAGYTRPDLVLGLGTGAVDITLRFGGVQAESGAVATSLIATAGTSVTRSRDSLVASSLPWFCQTQGCFALELLPQLMSEGYRWPLAFSATDAEVPDAIGIYTSPSNGATNMIRAAGTAMAEYPVDMWGGWLINKIAHTYSSARSAGSLNGGAVQSDTSVTLPGNVVYLRIGASGFGAALQNGCYRRLRYWNKPLLDLDLQRITQ